MSNKQSTGNEFSTTAVSFAPPDLAPNLTTYYNDLFISDSLRNLQYFYGAFASKEKLFEWMKKRPKGQARLFETEGDQRVIVVIPTADINSEFAKRCRDQVFTGLKVIFVEGNLRYDPYFNFAYNVNRGIHCALEFNPEWIIYSNDDMFKIDDVGLLLRELERFDNEKIDVLFSTPSLYHSLSVSLCKQRMTRKLAFSLTAVRRTQLAVEEKFGVKHFSTPATGIWKLFFKPEVTHLSIGPFGIFSSNYIRDRGGTLFDETYVNSAEDIDLEIELSSNQNRTASIDFKIGDYVGSSFGRKPLRRLRNVVGYAYLNDKIEKGIFVSQAQE